MGRKGVSKRKPSKSKLMPVSKVIGTAPISVEQKTESQAPRLLNKGEAISISREEKKITSEAGKKRKKR